MQKKRTLILFLLLGISFIAFLICFFAVYPWWISLTHQPPKSIIVISLDTLRADHLGIYGYHRNTSPSIDAFAKESIVFDHAVVQAQSTLPSHMSIMTSLYPSFHGVHASTKSGLADEHVTMAELLRAGGYKTAAFVDGGFVSATFGFYQGFDLYNDRSGGIVNILPRVKEWLEVNKSSPFFLFIHCYDIHDYDKDKPPSYETLFSDTTDSGQSKSGYEILKNALINKAPVDHEDLQHLIASYDGAIRYTDEKVGEFLLYLQASGLMDQSLIIITSDHGEEFMEHGYISHFQLYDRPNLHVPLIMRIPNYPRKEIKIKELVQSVDLLPTILDIAELPAHSKAQGRSLLPVIKRHKNFLHHSLWYTRRLFKKSRATISLAENIKKWSIISEDYQMIYDSVPHSWQLFNLKADPFAKHDVAENHPDISQELLSQYKKIHNIDPAYKAPEVTIDEKTRKQLEALGYVVFSEDTSDDTNDADNDGIQDDKDNCPSIANPNQEDFDGDRSGDLCDNCPYKYNPNQGDVDGEGIGDVCDSCTDWDLDGYGNPIFPNTCPKDNCPTIFNPGQEDEDGDGIGNICDNCPRNYNPHQEDADRDGRSDECDNCFETPNGPIIGTCLGGLNDGWRCSDDEYCGLDGFCSMDQEDSDGDDLGDVCDQYPEDYDNDAIDDLDDNCPLTENPGQEDTYPPQGNSIGDACECEGDFDCDGDVDEYDFETFMGNFNQRKLDKLASAIDLSKGDFDCDSDVDGKDQIKFLEDFGRKPSNNPCPACEVGDWCVYP